MEIYYFSARSMICFDVSMPNICKACRVRTNEGNPQNEMNIKWKFTLKYVT